MLLQNYIMWNTAALKQCVCGEWEPTKSDAPVAILRCGVYKLEQELERYLGFTAKRTCDDRSVAEWRDFYSQLGDLQASCQKYLRTVDLQADLGASTLAEYRERVASLCGADSLTSTLKAMRDMRWCDMECSAVATYNGLFHIPSLPGPAVLCLTLCPSCAIGACTEMERVVVHSALAATYEEQAQEWDDKGVEWKYLAHCNVMLGNLCRGDNITLSSPGDNAASLMWDVWTVDYENTVKGRR